MSLLVPGRFSSRCRMGLHWYCSGKAGWPPRSKTNDCLCACHEIDTKQKQQQEQQETPSEKAAT